MPGPERQLQRTVMARLTRLRLTEPGLVFRKRLGTAWGTTGDPDITGLWHGIHFEIELKAPGKHPTPLQAARMAEWGAAGAVTGVVRSIEDLDFLLERVIALFAI